MITVLLLSDDIGIRERVICTTLPTALTSYTDMLRTARRLVATGEAPYCSIGALGDCPHPLQAAMARTRVALNTTEAP